MIKHLPYYLIILFFFECNSFRKIEPAKKDNVEHVVIDKTFKPETIKPTFKIGSASISGNILEINIIGGCEKHSYKLISNGYYEKSLPPQIILHLADQQNKKPCDKKINKILFFDVSKLQYQGQHAIIIKFDIFAPKIKYLY